MAQKFDQLHFIMIPLMSQSHIIPITDFAKLLAKHGVHVSIVTTPLNAVRYDGVIQSAKAQNLKIQMIPIKFPSQAAGLPDGCENMDALNSPELSWRIFQACNMLQEPLEDLLRELTPKPSCIVSTNAIPWTQKVAEKFNIPRYNFETVSCFTLFCSRMIEDHALDKGNDSFLVPDTCHKIEFTKAQLPQTSNNDLDGSNEIMQEMKRVRFMERGTLINTFQELEPWYLDNYRKRIGNVWSIGPVSLCNKEMSEKSNRGDQATVGGDICLTWLDSMKPKSVIYACFGSLCHISVNQIKEIGLGLEESSHPFIWIIRKQDYSEELEEWLEGLKERVNGRGLVIHGWAPQVLILSHTSVGGFLTHCGWNSTLEGICAGVPMITWPMFAEQFFNEKFVVSVLGIGVMVGVESCMSNGDLVKGEKVKLAIEKVMDGEEEGAARRKRAEEIAKKAKVALEEGGSSYTNSIMLIQDVMKFNGDASDGKK